MKTCLILLATFVLSACSPSASTSNTFVLPDDLSHCRVILIDGGFGNDRIYLIKCPPGTVPDGYIGTSSNNSAGKSRKYHSVTII